MIAGTLFIGTVIVAVVQFLKELWPDKVNGAVSIVVAALIGLLVALVDREIGVENLSIAEGILTGLSAAGVVAVAKKI